MKGETRKMYKWFTIALVTFSGWMEYKRTMAERDLRDENKRLRDQLEKKA